MGERRGRNDKGRRDWGVDEEKRERGIKKRWRETMVSGNGEQEMKGDMGRYKIIS